MAKKDKDIKTNAMRILERLKLPFEHFSYECDEFVDGITTAEKLGLPKDHVYKTLVTHSPKGEYFVFVIPIEAELDLKKAARSVGAKSVDMLHVKDITNVTGYVRGGCTSIGMKKQFETRVDISAEKLDYMYVSGGKIGVQLKLLPADLLTANKGQYADLLREM